MEVWWVIIEVICHNIFIRKWVNMVAIKKEHFTEGMNLTLLYLQIKSQWPMGLITQIIIIKMKINRLKQIVKNKRMIISKQTAREVKSAN